MLAAKLLGSLRASVSPSASPLPPPSPDACSRTAPGRAAPLCGPDGMALYQVLGVGPHASKDEVRAAYKRQALAVHPDKGGCKDRPSTEATFGRGDLSVCPPGGLYRGP